MFIKLTQVEGGDKREITVQTEHIMFMYPTSIDGTCLMLGTYGAVSVIDKMEDILMFMDLPQLDILKARMAIESRLKDTINREFQLTHMSHTSVSDTIELNILQGRRIALTEAITIINENQPENLPF
jgi:hypothetical protein